jgi:hypothetical protein
MPVVAPLGLGLPTPSAIDQLAGGSSAVVFPDGITFAALRILPTVAQLQALAGTPLQLIPAPSNTSAGKRRIVVPSFLSWEVQQNASAITTSPNASPRYVGDATALLPSTQGGTNQVNRYNFYLTGKSGTTQVNVANVAPAIPIPPVSSAVELTGSNMVGGADSVHAITIFFYIVTLEVLP